MDEVGKHISKVSLIKFNKNGSSFMVKSALFIAKNPYSNESVSQAYGFKTINLSLLTYIPDDNFQNTLINLGYDDGKIDNYVLNSDISNIEFLDVSHKKINDLTGIEDFTNLKDLYCFGNELTNLDVSKNSKLIRLLCWDNYISSLDVSNNLNLLDLNCSRNPFPNIDLSKNTNLDHFVCTGSNLTSLDFSKNIKLWELKLWDNKLTYLNIKNGNNKNLNEINVSNNPYLTCIQVDNSKLSLTYPNWVIDASANYSEDCESTGIEPKELIKLVKVYPNPVKDELILEYIGNTKIIYFEILNSLSQIVYHSNMLEKSIVQTSNFIPGIYFIKLKPGEFFEFKKFVKIGR